jgi:putative transposase
MSFIDAHDFPAGLVLRVLDVAESTYDDWRARRMSPSRRELDDAALLEQILKLRDAHEFAATYGSPRVSLELRRQGVRVGRKRVERLMRTHGLQGAHLRRGWRHGSTRQNPQHTAAPDLVERDFRAEAPNRLWVADLTRLVTGEGVLWLATVRGAERRERSPTASSAGPPTRARRPPWCSPRSTTPCASGRCGPDS